MDTLLLIISFLLAIPLAISIFNGFSGPYLKHYGSTEYTPFVSILVPARNEEKNIEGIITSLKEQDYPEFEIIILDDESTDSTYSLGSKYQDKRMKIIKGNVLPGEWLGKNWACQQLADSAKGNIFIFTDADNRHSINAVKSTVSAMQKHNLDFLSAFPQQFAISFWEKMIVPMIDLIIYSFLPMWFTYLLPFKSLAAANGQWIAIRKEAYLRLGGHKSVKGKVVEDIELARRAKSLGLKTLVASGKDLVYSRMYESLEEIKNGLGKNLYGLTGNNPAVFFLFLFFFLFICIIPFAFLPFSLYALIPFGMILFWQAILATCYKHNYLRVILYPVSFIGIVLIGIRSFLMSSNGEIQWKGRSIIPRNG